MKKLPKKGNFGKKFVLKRCWSGYGCQFRDASGEIVLENVFGMKMRLFQSKKAELQELKPALECYAMYANRGTLDKVSRESGSAKFRDRKLIS